MSSRSSAKLPLASVSSGRSYDVLFIEHWCRTSSGPTPLSSGDASSVRLGDSPAPGSGVPSAVYSVHSKVHPSDRWCPVSPLSATVSGAGVSSSGTSTLNGSGFPSALATAHVTVTSVTSRCVSVWSGIDALKCLVSSVVVGVSVPAPLDSATGTNCPAMLPYVVLHATTSSHRPG